MAMMVSSTFLSASPTRSRVLEYPSTIFCPFVSDLQPMAKSATARITAPTTLRCDGVDMRISSRRQQLIARLSQPRDGPNEIRVEPLVISGMLAHRLE